MIRVRVTSRSMIVSEDHLEENIVGCGRVEGCSIASPITLHVIDLDAVAIVALQDMMMIVMVMVM